MVIDTSFDVRTGLPPGKDPDTYSPTLRRYHRLLWSKPLPGGRVLSLDDTLREHYLFDAAGGFSLTSDSVIPTFSERGRLWLSGFTVPIDELLAFESLGYTIGGMMVFPGWRVGRQMTINGARGCHPRIRDRFDLTVECIRRHYLGRSHPLEKALQRYADFFALFVDFRGYVDFFLLQDLVAADYSEVRFFLPCEDFPVAPVPRSREAYTAYRERAEAFLRARNQRISEASIRRVERSRLPTGDLGA